MGYSGHKPAYSKPIVNIEHRKDPSFTFNAMKLRMRREKIEDSKPYTDLGDRF